MTDSERAAEIVKLCNEVGVGRDDITLHECNLRTAITAALDAKDARIAKLREALKKAKLHFEAMAESTTENGAPTAQELIAHCDKYNEECVQALAEDGVG